jgi:Xaa-Pro dipeptidase
MQHFRREEYETRVSQLRRGLVDRRLSALIAFSQESHFYLTGYDSVGYLFFQCSVITADDQPITLLTRRPDLQQARDTSTIEDIRLWYNTEGADPSRELKAILEEKGLKGCRLGIELDTYGLTGANWERVRVALDGWCTLEDASDIVRSMRAVKSAAELEHVREAARLADLALIAMAGTCRPGCLEGDISAAGLTAILAAGGDPPPAGPLCNAGRRALFGRSVCGPNRVNDPDQVAVEFAGTYRRYNACLYRVIWVGEVKPAQRRMFAAVSDAMEQMIDAARPGRPLGEIDDAHRRVLDEHGYSVNRFAACGYSLGATYKPSWMDVPPMIFSGNSTAIAPGMILFLHAHIGDPESGFASAVGQTLEITKSGHQVLSKLPLEVHAG